MSEQATVYVVINDRYSHLPMRVTFNDLQRLCDNSGFCAVLREELVAGNRVIADGEDEVVAVEFGTIQLAW
jgi:hypothetical protein